MESVKTCPRCKHIKDISNFKSYRDKIVKTCQSCRDYVNQNRIIYKCVHDKQRSQCRDCNGSSICRHRRRKQQCKDCNGSSICKHQRQRHRCKDCNGTSICKHQRLRHRCKDCNGTSICEHQRIRHTCKDCNGASICVHQRMRNQCQICDPIGHLSSVCRTRIYQALKSNKEFSSKKYIGCSIEEFKQHIETQFKPDMTWENYGILWHIDHIIPLKYNNPTIEEVTQRLHYTNTQPLYAFENIAKGNRYIS